jgi:hypothetical protein
MKEDIYKSTLGDTGEKTNEVLTKLDRDEMEIRNLYKTLKKSSVVYGTN